MTREIKFRAWIRDKKTMYDSKEFMSMAGFSYFLNNNNLVIPMQYSGLKDSNNIDIYEGDIVYLAGYGNYTVEFPFFELYDAYDAEDIGLIIGNIYANPELEEEDK